MEIITKSAKETEKLGKQIAVKLKAPAFIAFYGDLGAGKTTLIQAIAKGLEIKKRVISPTFVLAREYEVINNQFGLKKLYHVDLYRINNSQEVKAIGIREMIKDKKGAVLVEWAERMRSILPEKRIDARMENIGENKRKIIIKGIDL